MNWNAELRASACVLNRHRSSSSHSRVAKKLSHMALSYASPTEPIEGRTPASRQRRPNSIEVYCEPWSE
jgi:hypothetical protein